MIRLVKAELFKLSKNRTFKILSIIAIFLSILNFIMTTSVFDKLVEESINEIPKEQVEQMLNLGTNTENQCKGYF